ncbi:MAG: hypothetical protein SFW67_23990 [Myxococcaceae bacterium]|nr:hypothetical protein [Myxococcaceae bacterium]
MEDRIRLASDELYLWPAAKPGLSIRGSFVGRAVLTDTRFLFLSAGAHEARDRALAALLFGRLGKALLGQSTKDLDLRALENAGSLEVPLESLEGPHAGRRWDFATWFGFTHPRGVASLMPRTSLLWSGAKAWAEALVAAKSESAASGRGAGPA